MPEEAFRCNSRQRDWCRLPKRVALYQYIAQGACKKRPLLAHALTGT